MKREVKKFYCLWYSAVAAGELISAVVVWTLLVRPSGTERGSYATGRWNGRDLPGQQAEEEEIL